MSEKKKSFLNSLFKSNSSGCACGVTIVDEEKKDDVKAEKKKEKQIKK